MASYDLQQILEAAAARVVFPYPIREKTPERDGFICAAHNCIAVYIGDESPKAGMCHTAMGVLADVVQFCLDNGYDAVTIGNICNQFQWAQTGRRGLLGQDKFLYFQATTYVERAKT